MLINAHSSVDFEIRASSLPFPYLPIVSALGSDIEDVLCCENGAKIGRRRAIQCAHHDEPLVASCELAEAIQKFSRAFDVLEDLRRNHHVEFPPLLHQFFRGSVDIRNLCEQVPGSSYKYGKTPECGNP